MLQKVATTAAVFLFAFVILSVSLLRSAATNYSFAQTPDAQEAMEEEKEEVVEIDYTLPYPGRIMPDDLLWPVKAARDRLWLLVTTNTLKKAELNLLFADKRLVSAEKLFEQQNPEVAVTTLTKAEKYLEKATQLAEQAGREGKDNAVMLQNLSRASLMHRQMLENMVMNSPEDAKPIVVEATNYPKNAYQKTRSMLSNKGIEAPKSPFGD